MNQKPLFAEQARGVQLGTTRLRRLLCAVDVERAGATSLAMAALLSERFDASVDALYAPALPVAELDAGERLAGMVASMPRKVSVSSFVASGPASAAILTHSERYTSDLIVMASSPSRRFATSADTIAPVSAHAPCAVLTLGDRFRPAELRRILLPVGPAGVERLACGWVTALASRFDAEVGLLRIDQPRSGFWKTYTGMSAPNLSPGDALECAKVLASLCRAGIDAYEIAHPGGNDGDALARLCETGAFDAIVLGLPVAAEGRASADVLAAAVRQKTSAPVLSVRSPLSPVLFAPSCFEPSRTVAAPALCA